MGKGKNIGESSCLFGEIPVNGKRKGSTVVLMILDVFEAPFKITYPGLLHITCPVDQT